MADRGGGDCQSVQQQFGSQRLESLYSSNSDEYLAQFETAATSLMEEGFLRPSDAEILTNQARAFADRVLGGSSTPPPSAAPTPAASPSPGPEGLAVTGSAAPLIGLLGVFALALGALITGTNLRRRRT